MLKKGKRVFFLPESEIGSCAYKGVALRTAFIFFVTCCIMATSLPAMPCRKEVWKIQRKRMQQCDLPLEQQVNCCGFLHSI